MSEALHEDWANALSGEKAHRRRRPLPAFVEQFPAIVRDTPCYTGGAANYIDARYWLDRAVPRALASGAAFDAQKDTLPGVSQCLTATNLAELPAGTHALPRGALVQVFAFYTRSRPATKLFVFNQPVPGGGGVVVSMTGNAAGGGKYTGNLLAGPSTAVASGDLAMPEGMTLGAAALILNLAEQGPPSSHWVEANTTAPGVLVSRPGDPAIIAVSLGPPHPLFAVTVAKTAGSAGDAVTPCTYVYTVTSLAGVTLATGKSPLWSRPAGALNPASHGTAYYDAAGTLQLSAIDETPQTVACS